MRKRARNHKLLTAIQKSNKYIKKLYPYYAVNNKYKYAPLYTPQGKRRN